jgi:hypothetical protein
MHYWLTPPDLLAALHNEFQFDCDPCPHPLPHPSYNSLELPWGQINYVNPPFLCKDNTVGAGVSAFVRKVIAEHKQGKQSVLVLPVPSHVNVLLHVGAEVRPMRKVGWISAKTGEPCKSPVPSALFILRKGDPNHD